MASFYERHPYPPPVDDLAAYRAAWNDGRRRAESFLLWPHERYRDDRSILVAGCGTVQAAHYAVRWPKARVVGIDLSEASLDFTRQLKERHGLANLEVRRLPLERAVELEERFEHVVCTGVLHHLADPAAGLRALHDVMTDNAALHAMVYAPYGRNGVTMLQEYARRLRISATEDEIGDLAASLRALPPDHPLVPLLRSAPDFATVEGIADALLHPRERTYSVPQLFEALGDAGLAFGRWTRQAPYSSGCGAIASTPHAHRLAELSPPERYAALELFRGTMLRHSFIAYRSEATARRARPDFDGEAWRAFVPVALPETVVVRDKLPAGAAAVLINRNHTYTDLYLPVDSMQARLFAGVDGSRSIAQIAAGTGQDVTAREFFRTLWTWDQIVFHLHAN